MILRASENIMKIITDYYNFFGAKFNNIVDADDLLSIYNYITLKSNVPNLATHCILIEKFSTNSTLNSLSGFYLTTIQASIDFLIADINEDFMQKNIQQKKDQYFSCLNELNNINEQQSKKKDELSSQNKKIKNSSQKNENENGIPAVQEYDDTQ
ncbi:hypothetical protein PPERSA_04812 [Pseudocohnilembus persalinus]|uniref:VPS9 domain-containing protein n=1 Tax=Pseudocohnilembus persalinus TaxID=266149 RepID=A0A0V0QKZ7_PSEPJ|nr:hypothetical protein PPERSA_04812 [Pseudocohnilembus persalinus]|eukprot:KRX03017.1 hypothetical protein PPERSA_04812 [Pseudocohnilembus persalinus]